jgi:hypothetical protein
MPETFDQWAVVELFGHQRIAGRVTEQAIGGATFIRVDVPDGDTFFTRMFGPSAIYSITPCTEEVCRQAATRIDAKPVFAIPLPSLTAPAIRELNERYDPDDDPEVGDDDPDGDL